MRDILLVFLGLLLLVHTGMTMWVHATSQEEMQRVFQYMRQICRNTTIDPMERRECDR